MNTISDWMVLREFVVALVSKMLNQREMPIGIDGTIIGGSWDATSGTALVIRCDTAALIPNGYDQAAYATRVPIHTPSYIMQYGVVGNERVILYETQSGPAAMIKFDVDDSPGTKAGEMWITHRNAAGAFDVNSKWTNDGPSTSDGLGGLTHVGGALHLTQTAGGLTTRHDDTAKKITTTANAGTYTLWDANGNAIHVVAPSVGLGDLFSNLGVTRAAMANADITTYSNTLKQVIGNVAQQMAQAAISSGVTNAAAWLTAIQAGLPTLSFVNIASSIPAITVPAGSSTVRLKA